MSSLIGKKILNYEIVSLIGKGGMGTVYLGINSSIGQKVAIKVLNEELVGSQMVRDRMKKEAQTLLLLDHPGIVKLLNYVEQDDNVFLIMEFVEGESLQEFLTETNGLIVEDRAYDIIREILEAFEYAHEHNVIHRDIKPANIFITKDKHIKVLDFGIAHLVTESNDSEKGWLVGTPAYMSPEQVNCEELDNRSDIYSLGVLIHTMLTGKVPYDSTTMSDTEIKDLVVNKPLPRMKEYYPYISDKMQKIVDKATAKDKAKRYDSCKAMLADVKAVLAPEPTWKYLKYVVAAVLVIACGVGIWAWTYYRDSTSYYKDIVERWGVYEGVGELSSSDVGHSNSMYRIIESEGKVRRVSYVNSFGKLIDDSESEHIGRPTDAYYYYRDNGNVDFVVYKDRSGKSLYKMKYEEKDGKINMAVFQYDDKYNTERCLPNSLVGYYDFANESEDKGRVSRYFYTFDEDGFVTKLRYGDRFNQEVGDANNIYGIVYTRDEKGRVLTLQYINESEEPQSTKWGLSLKKFEYDDSDNWVKTYYFGIDGSPVMDDSDGTFIYSLEYDKYGNLVKTLHMGPTGELMMTQKQGIAGQMREYDEHGLLTKVFNLDTSGNPFYNGAGCGYSYEYDANGYVTKMSNIDKEGNVVPGSDGTVTLRFENNEHGDQLRFEYVGLDGQLMALGDGYAAMEYEYDSVGNIIESRYISADGNPFLYQGIYSKTKSWYNDKNKILKTVYYKDDQPCLNETGVACYVYEYDVKGNMVSLSFFADEEASKPVMDKWGRSRVTYKYNESGKTLEQKSFDAEGDPCNDDDGYCMIVYTYDKNGNMLSRRFYDKNGSLVISRSDEVAGENYKYDEHSNIVEIQYVGADGKLMPNLVVVRYEYDKYSNQTKMAFFNIDGTKTFNTKNYHMVEYKYDELRKVVEERYCDINDNLVEIAGTEYSIHKYKYDSFGFLVEQSFWKDDKLRGKDENGVFRRCQDRDSQGRIVREINYDASDNPVSMSGEACEAKVVYDNRGNTVEFSYWDGRGNRVASEYGYATFRADYDERNNITEIRYYNEKDELLTEGVAIVRYAYNQYGNEVSCSYHDAQGNPTVCGEGYFKMESIYDSSNPNILVERKYYDTSGKLISSENLLTGEKKEEAAEPRPSSGDSRPAPNPDEAPLVSNQWRKFWREAAANCPMNFGNGVEITSISVSSSLQVKIKLLDESKYDFSDEDMSFYKKWVSDFKSTMRKESEMPKSVRFTVIMLDKADRELFRS